MFTRSQVLMWLVALTFANACNRPKPNGHSPDLGTNAGSATPEGEKGDVVGNGGSIIVDGRTYRLADLFFEPHVGDSFHFADPLLQRLQDLRLAMETWRLAPGEFFDEQIFSDEIFYYFTSTLPDGCDDSFSVRDDLPVIQIACTRGNFTWIIPEFFVGLSLEERVGLLVHERLHAFSPTQPHEAIAPVAAGSVHLQAFLDQSQKVRVSDNIAQALHSMRIFAKILGLTDEKTPAASSLRVSAFGGGLISQEANVPETTFVSLGSWIEGASTLAENLEIIDSTIVDTSIGADSTIEESIIHGIISEGATIQRSQIHGKVGAHTSVVDSTLHKGTVLAANVLVESSDVDGEVGANSTLIHSTLSGNLGETCRVEKSRLTVGGKIDAECKVQETVVQCPEIAQFGKGFFTIKTHISADDCQIGTEVKIARSRIANYEIRLGNNTSLEDTYATHSYSSVYPPYDGFAVGESSRIKGLKGHSFLAGKNTTIEDVETGGPIVLGDDSHLRTVQLVTMWGFTAGHRVTIVESDLSVFMSSNYPASIRISDGSVILGSSLNVGAYGSIILKDGPHHIEDSTFSLQDSDDPLRLIFAGQHRTSLNCAIDVYSPFGIEVSDGCNYGPNSR